MKKLLLVTTALAGTALLAPAASAVDLAAEFQDGASPVVQRNPAFAVRLTGRLLFEITWQDQDVDEQKPGGIFKDIGGLAVIGTATADNGLSYGFNYNITENRVELHVSNRLGRVSMGNTFTATDSLDVGGSSVLVGRGHVFGGGLDLFVIPPGGAGAVSLTRPHGIPGIPGGFVGGNTIRYSTPNYGGLTVAISYTNETGNNVPGFEIDGDGITHPPSVPQALAFTSNGEAFHAEDVFSIAAQYTSSYGNYTTVVYAGYEVGNRTTKDNADYGLHGGHHDVELYSVGAKVTGMGAGFAAGYGERRSDTNFPTLHDDDGWWWDIAASFSAGPASVSVGYLHNERDAADFNFTPAQKHDAFSISANLVVGPGVFLSAGATILEVRDATVPIIPGVGPALPELFAAGGDNNSTSFTISTTMVF